ncbi:MAG: DUF3073 domain-containing protein [Corynebacterium sp.]|nr:DUF3073 domain-containing protein [Corynebacterium sp.]
MGRGRAKAKQAKVARQLKYNVPNMDLDSLQRELAAKNHHEEDDQDQYAAWADYDPEEDSEAK